MADMHATARPRSNAARICTILAFVFAVVAIFVAPVIFGIAGLVLGIVGAVLGDKPLGWYAAAASVVGAIIGVALVAAIINN
ncbi:hypothetical protein FHX75_1444 [Micromonospora palomenae]|uniref:Uncharacterized protein n=1 Tax=Micromonospora palomenae TaxID=1461247 RepID=A0A561VJD0_9ACTN|nr:MULTISPECIES: hypothetical protein [Micromonospora]MBQ0893635.1 hypothetical protein [Micromonospora sp. U56]MDH6460502.1 putative Mn2+ efflux pump MntP [Micromonospora sp. A200]TWG11719.1 hypothetical protein FHX75_1444 [Micromonospora palomenae]